MTTPDKWQWVKLGDHVTKVGSGLTPRGGQSVYRQSGIPLIRSQNVHMNRFETEGLAFISPEQDEEMKQTRVQPGDVLLNITGASIGRVCVVPTRICPANVNQHVCIIRSDGTIDPGFLTFFISNPDFQRFIQDSQSGATRQALTKYAIENFRVPYPPLPEQKRIVAILAKADRLRRLRRTARALSDTYLQSVFLEMFGNPVTNPKGFPLAQFGQVCETRLGKMLDAKQQMGENRHPYLRNVDVQWGRIDLSDLQEMDFGGREREILRLRKGDVLICEGGEVGRAAIWNNELPEMYYQKALHRARPDPELAVPEFIVWLMWCLANLGGLVDFTSQVTIAHLTGVKLRTIEFPLPPLPLQQQFARLVRKFKRLRARQREAERQAEHLFHTLLHRAFRGEL